jgi:hypothetical protein
MSVSDVLMGIGIFAGGLSIFGMGFALLAASRGDAWQAGYRAGKATAENAAPVQPAPVIVLTQPTKPEPATIDATWRDVQPSRRFVVVGEPEVRPQLTGNQPRRLTGGSR